MLSIEVCDDPFEVKVGLNYEVGSDELKWHKVAQILLSTYTHMHVDMHAHHTHACMHAHAHIYTHTHMHTFTHIHSNIHTYR